MPDGTCICPKGYSGRTCEVRACDGVDCKNGGTCEMPDGTCKCPDCFYGNYCENENFRCCKDDTDCNTPQGRCVNGSCECVPSVTGDKCQNTGCADVTCVNGGSCDKITGKCVCPTCYEGSNCETHKANSCETTKDCNPPNGVCSGSNTCECKTEYPAPNCEDLCSDVHCTNGGVCDAATGKCQCAPGWGGKQCTEAQPCGTGGTICPVTATCDPATSACVCKAGYGGEGCVEIALECSETCKEGGAIIMEGGSKECQVDCFSLCCKHLKDSCEDKSGDDLVKCIFEAMREDEKAECCLLPQEGQAFISRSGRNHSRGSVE